MEVVPDHPVGIGLTLESDLQVTVLRHKRLHFVDVVRLLGHRVDFLEPVVGTGHAIGTIDSVTINCSHCVVVIVAHGNLCTAIERSCAVLGLDILDLLIHDTAVEVGLVGNLFVVVTCKALQCHLIGTLGQVGDGLAQVELSVPSFEVVGSHTMLGD